MAQQEIPPTLEELIEAREDLKQQIERLRSPALGRDYNPRQISKLDAMLQEIVQLIAEMESAKP
jgi:hypothetical protein